MTVAQRQGTRAHEAHVALEHVEELRQLVDAPAPQHASDLGHARVVLDLEDGPGGFVQGLQLALLGGRVLLHGAELEAAERFLTHADAPVAEEHGARCGELDDQGAEEHDGGEEHEAQQGEDHVGEAFAHITRAAHRVRFDHEQRHAEPGHEAHVAGVLIVFRRGELQNDTARAARLDDARHGVAHHLAVGDDDLGRSGAVEHLLELRQHAEVGQACALLPLTRLHNVGDHAQHA